MKLKKTSNLNEKRNTENQTNLPESHTIPIDEMQLQQCIQYVDATMEKRGYVCTIQSPNGLYRGYSHTIHGIHANVHIHSPIYITIELSSTWKLFKIISGDFSFDHPKFRKWYEKPLLKIKRKLKEMEDPYDHEI